MMYFHEVYYTREKAKKMQRECPWYKPYPIICEECDMFHDLVCFAEIQIQGKWLCHGCRERLDREIEAKWALILGY